MVNKQRRIRTMITLILILIFDIVEISRVVIAFISGPLSYFLLYQGRLRNHIVVICKAFLELFGRQQSNIVILAVQLEFLLHLERRSFALRHPYFVAALSPNFCPAIWCELLQLQILARKSLHAVIDFCILRLNLGVKRDAHCHPHFGNPLGGLAENGDWLVF